MASLSGQGNLRQCMPRALKKVIFTGNLAIVNERKNIRNMIYDV